MWLLWGLPGCYMVYVLHFYNTKIVLCGFYGTDLREGVTVAIKL